MNPNEYVGELKDRPAYVQFERIAMEDKKASREQGKYVARDVDFVHITPPNCGGKTVVDKKVSAWFDAMEMDGRIPPDWVKHYKTQYEAWKNGQEIPLNGTPIKGWGVISPAQQEMLIQAKVLTVEDLAVLNDEGGRFVGIGYVDLRNKAKAWLAQLGDKGPLTIEMAELKRVNDVQAIEIATLKEQVSALLAQSRQVPLSSPNSITADDILGDLHRLNDDLPADEEKPKRHRRTKAEMEAART